MRKRILVAVTGVVAATGLGIAAVATADTPSAPASPATGTHANAVAVPNSDVRVPSAAAAMLDVASARGVALPDGTAVVIGPGRDADMVCMMRLSATDGNGVAAGGCSPAKDVARRGLEVAHVPPTGPATVVAYLGDSAATTAGINGVPHIVRAGVVVFGVPRTGGDVEVQGADGVRRMTFPDWSAQDAQARTYRLP